MQPNSDTEVFQVRNEIVSIQKLLGKIPIKRPFICKKVYFRIGVSAIHPYIEVDLYKLILWNWLKYVRHA